MSHFSLAAFKLVFSFPDLFLFILLGAHKTYLICSLIFLINLGSFCLFFSNIFVLSHLFPSEILITCMLVCSIESYSFLRAVFSSSSSYFSSFSSSSFPIFSTSSSSSSFFFCFCFFCSSHWIIYIDLYSRSLILYYAISNIMLSPSRENSI